MHCSVCIPRTFQQRRVCTHHVFENRSRPFNTSNLQKNDVLSECSFGRIGSLGRMEVLDTGRVVSREECSEEQQRRGELDTRLKGEVSGTIEQQETIDMNRIRCACSSIAKHRQELTLHGAGTWTLTCEHERMSRTTALAHHPNEEKIDEQEQQRQRRKRHERR